MLSALFISDQQKTNKEKDHHAQVLLPNSILQSHALSILWITWESNLFLHAVLHYGATSNYQTKARRHRLSAKAILDFSL